MWLHANAAYELVVDEVQHELNETEVAKVEVLRQRRIQRGANPKASSGSANANATSSSTNLYKVLVKRERAAEPGTVRKSDDLVVVNAQLASCLDRPMIQSRESAPTIGVGPESLRQQLRAVCDAERAERRAGIRGPDAGGHLAAQLGRRPGKPEGAEQQVLRDSSWDFA